MQKGIVLGLTLVSLSLLWWAALVFYHRGIYYSIPRVSICFLIGALISFIYSLKDTGEKDSAERWFFRSEEL